MNKCFQNDWNLNKLQKYIKNEYDQKYIQNLLKLSNFIQAYSHQVLKIIKGDIWVIQQQSFFDLINDLDIISSNKMTYIDANLKYVATLAGNLKGNQRMPERGLVRCQFMEFLVRSADEIYLKTQISDNIGQATKLLIQDHCYPIFCKNDSQKFRNDLYWNQNCEKVQLFFKAISESIFKNYSNKKVKPGQKKFMCLDEFKDIFQQCQLYDENFQEKDMFLSYNLSMMTQIDEINDEKFMQMSYIEFLEALSRAANKISLIYHNNKNNQMTYIERIDRPLYEKIEGLYMCILKLAENYVKNSFRVPQKSIFEIIENLQEESE